ncbi:dual specificity phosphatase [Aspergillus campestris IBT 28561]|uniref:protein-tyrosine-phosphatase n=1 Tax=Aspergillus campestris (strain IBT 28561) TaxID=1392248 RepID=A0A2I1DC21_ASPC2|nr:dual specificity phosphatase [Aspergillus campestris IBT 28561]PKY07411.1 dual specificity phosphatase [Aspergillus campestris IBT 28561]
MGESGDDAHTEKDRNKRWEMAFKARMRQIIPGLFLGNVEASHKQDMLRENRITAIVSLTDARWVWWNTTTREAGIPEQRHKWVQCADSSTQDLLAYMNDICDFIDQMASPALLSSTSLEVQPEHYESNVEPRDVPSEAILIHCDLGISRSPTIIIAYLMRKYAMKQDDIMEFIQFKQKVKPSANFLRQLQVWEEVE